MNSHKSQTDSSQLPRNGKNEQHIRFYTPTAQKSNILIRDSGMEIKMKDPQGTIHIHKFTKAHKQTYFDTINILLCVCVCVSFPFSISFHYIKLFSFDNE